MDPAAESKPAKSRILWDMEESAPADKSVLEAEREKHQQRAERFGVKYTEPGKRKELALEHRKERLKREGFVTGIDVFAPEEEEKRRNRAARFQVAEPALQYKPDEAELKKKQRAAKFGTSYTPPTLMDVDLYEERKDAQAEVERRQDAVHVYGVDLMSTRDVLQYFRDYGPTFVEWINDSSCNVTFEDFHTVKRAIVGMGQPLLSDEAAPDGAAWQDSAEVDVSKVAHLWHKGREPFMKGNTPIDLMFRVATVEDRKDLSAPRRSRELWKLPIRKAKRRLEGEADGGGPQQYDVVDDEGDVNMGRSRRQRGGRRMRRRMQRLVRVEANGDEVYEDDVEMVDADEWVEEEEEPAAAGEPVTGPAAADGIDLRQLLSRPHEAPLSTFSAVAAGLVVEPAAADPATAAPPAEAAAPGVAAAGDGSGDEMQAEEGAVGAAGGDPAAAAEGGQVVEAEVADG